MSDFRMELRSTLRGLSRARTLAAAAVICLALGIGATTSIFTAVDAALLRPLPFPQAERLVNVFRTTPQFDSGPFSPATFLDLRRSVGSLSSLSAVTSGSALLQVGEHGQRISKARVSDDFFSTLAAKALHGRVIRPGDDDPAADPVAVITEELWRERFGGDPGTVGRRVRIDGESHEIVGILPPGFKVPNGSRVFQPDVWVPLRFTPQQAAGRGNNFLMLIGRLGSRADVSASNAELHGIMDGIASENPDLQGEQVRVVPLQAASVYAIRGPLLLLLGAVGFVLLIAAANVASLLLARGLARRGEWAVRSAMGAGWAEMLRATLLDSAVLAVVGATAGIGLAWAGVRLIGALVPSGLPQLVELHVDARILAFALGLAALVALVCGTVPALQAQRVAPADALRGEGRSGSAGRHHRLLRGLIIAEVALSLVLLLGAGLVLRGFERLVSQDPGFDPVPLLTLNVDLAPDRYPDGGTAERFLHPALEQIRALPGVQEAAAISLIPYTDWGWNFNIRYEGQPVEERTRLPLVETRIATPSLFATLGMRLERGRLLSPADDASPNGPTVVVANEALAARDFPGQDPIGKRFHTSDTTFATIVGIVSDIKNLGPDNPPSPEVYYSYARGWSSSTSFPLIVRVQGDPSRSARAIESAIHTIDPTAAVSAVRPMRQVIEESEGRPRFYLVLIGVFAGVALLLALAGLYGITSYFVEQRRHELGIRSALGSTAGRTVALVMRQGLGLVVIGGIVGLAGGAMLTRLLSGLLYGLSPLDPVTWLVVSAALCVVAALAILVPARRASAVDPLVAMRAD